MKGSNDLLSQKKDRVFRKLKLLLESEQLPQSAHQVMLLSDILSHIIENERHFRNGRFRNAPITEMEVMLFVDA